MARCLIGPKKVSQYRRKTGLDVLCATVRGGTGHRVDLLIGDGSIVYLFPDGTLRKEENQTWDVELWRSTQQMTKK